MSTEFDRICAKAEAGKTLGKRPLEPKPEIHWPSISVGLKTHSPGLMLAAAR